MLYWFSERQRSLSLIERLKMKKQIINGLSNEVTQMKELLEQNCDDLAFLIKGINTLTCFSKNLSHKSLEIKVTEALLESLNDINNKTMSLNEWITFGSYLHEVGNVLIKTAISAQEQENNDD